MNTSERGYNLFVIFVSLLVVGLTADEDRESTVNPVGIREENHENILLVMVAMLAKWP